MTVRIGSVWDSTQQVLAGRTGMLAPIAAIGFVLPSVMQVLLLPQTPGASPGFTGVAVALIAILLSLWGQLAIMALATHPATTQAEAGRVGVARMLPVLGIALVIALVLAAVILVPLLVLGLSGYDFAAAMAAGGNPALMPPVPGGAGAFVTLYMLGTAVVAIWLAARLMLVYAVVLNERRGLGAFRRSIALTRGMTWRLIGVCLLFLIVLTVATLAAQGVTGTVARLLLGPERLATARGIAALAGAVVSAGFMTMADVFVARRSVVAAGQPQAAAPVVAEDGSPLS